MRLRGSSIAIVLFLFAVGCEVEEIIEAEPPTARLKLDPLVLDFGILSAGSSLTQEVTIRNTGNAGLALEDLFVEGSQSFVLEETGVDRILGPGDQTVLPVTFAPQQNEEASGILHIVASDPDLMAGSVDLEGTGAAPAIEIDPADHTFDDVGVGCEHEVEITITNVGWGRLELTGVVFAPTSDEFEYAFYFGPGSYLEPNESESIKVYYTPRDELQDTAYLHVYSDDPAHPDAVATITGSAYLCPEVEDTFVQEEDEGTDILWVVDNGGVVLVDPSSLAIQFATFMDLIEIATVDYHIGVVTTDSPNLQGAVPIMTPATPDVHAAFADAVGVGTAGSAMEQGLQMAWEALSPPNTDPGGPNAGFLRDTANLHVIVVSDDDDQSPDSVAAYVSAIQGLKDDPDHVEIHGVVLLPAPRYELAAAMTAGQIVDLYAADWATSLASLSGISVTHQDTFELTGDLVIETLEVEIDGAAVHSGWAYDVVLNAVVFQPDSIPDPGETITVRYSPLADCDGC
jgi:hypothetical protein